MDWVASTLHTTSEHGVSSITTADAHTSVASSRLNWRPCRFKWTRPFRERRNLVSARVLSRFKQPYLRKCLQVLKGKYCRGQFSTKPTQIHLQLNTALNTDCLKQK